jgi:SAM-dependent methyltransferase
VTTSPTRLLAHLAELRRPLREVPLAAFPELTGYTRADVHDGLQGQGGLFLASDMVKMLRLSAGMKVLDLACGRGSTSVFLARRFGVRVFAVDESPSDSLLERAAAAGVAELITPIRADCRHLPFAGEYFDAVFCMNSLFYFGTDDLFPPYILSYLKPGGELVVGSPCYRAELTADTPEEFLLEFPACLAVHSPGWWKNHFEKSKQAVVLYSELHPRGVEFWEDRVKFLLDTQKVSEMSEGRREMLGGIVRMLSRDHDGFVSHFMLHLKKNMPNHFPQPALSAAD